MSCSALRSPDLCRSVAVRHLARAFCVMVSLAGATLWGQQIATPDHQATAADRSQRIDSEQIAQLIVDLADENFDVREAATQKLIGAGEAALEQLKVVQEHDANLEVRARARALTTEIDKEVFQRVSKNFLLDFDGSKSYGLPAWQPFSELVGVSRSSKQLFLQMLIKQRDLADKIESASQASDSAAELQSHQQLAIQCAVSAEQLRQQMTRERRMPEIGDTVALLTAGAVLKTSVPMEANETIIASMYRREVVSYFSKGGYDRCMRALTGKWLPKTQDIYALSVMSISVQLNVPEGVEVARRSLSKPSDIESRELAFHCLARHGNISDLPLLQPLLDDESILTQFPENSLAYGANDITVEDAQPPGIPKVLRRDDNARRMVVKVSDVALAVSMLLSGDDVATVYPRFRHNANRDFFLNDVAFGEDENERHLKAIENWKAKKSGRQAQAN